MQSRYSEWAGPLVEIGRFEWERVIKKCAFNQMSTKLVALLLATYASEDGANVRPGRERLIAASGLSKGYISTQLGKLEDLGLVFKVHNGSSYGRRGGLASVYQLTVPTMLFKLYQDDPSELAQLEHELAWDSLTSEQVHPSGHVAVSNTTKHVHPSEHVSPVKAQEHVQSAEEQVHSSKEHVHSEAEQVHPSGPHQVKAPSKNHQSKIINQIPAASPFVTRAKEPIDNAPNGSYSGPAMEDERRRQMEALQKLIDGEKAS